MRDNSSVVDQDELLRVINHLGEGDITLLGMPATTAHMQKADLRITPTLAPLMDLDYTMVRMVEVGYVMFIPAVDFNEYFEFDGEENIDGYRPVRLKLLKPLSVTVVKDKTQGENKMTLSNRNVINETIQRFNEASARFDAQIETLLNEEQNEEVYAAYLSVKNEGKLMVKLLEVVGDYIKDISGGDEK